MISTTEVAATSVRVPKSTISMLREKVATPAQIGAGASQMGQCGSSWSTSVALPDAVAHRPSSQWWKSVRGNAVNSINAKSNDAGDRLDSKRRMGGEYTKGCMADIPE